MGETNNNWIGNLDRIIFLYNDSKHRATGVKPFILFKNFDYSSFSTYNPSSNTNINLIKQRLIEYVNTYRREYEIRAREIITLNSIVIMVRPYNAFRCRRTDPLGSLYYPDNYTVTSIEGEYCLLRNNSNLSVVRANIKCLKPIINLP
ncbi:hypothetical protein DMUE_5687 [Dictyocoela muelleri]|nr:hypothetical protein DMUE_5687 [Dictyocoela muelleri]